MSISFLHLDHLTVTCHSLAQGEQWVFNQLGIHPQQGGEHPQMGTHNLLLKLGHQQFLEVIAPNPAMPSPNRSRWFDLDSIGSTDQPKLACWVAQTPDIKTSMAQSLQNLGEAESISRGDYQWVITIPQDGKLLMNGCAPSLIQWQCLHPATNLHDLGCQLLELEIRTPQKDQLVDLLDALQFEERESLIKISQSQEARLIAKILTPNGVKYLGLESC